MSLKLVQGSQPDPSAANLGDASRVLAPNAPLSPGPLPPELRELLRSQEPVVWWNQKTNITWIPIYWVAGSMLFVLALASLIVPEFWMQPMGDIAAPLAALAMPVLAIYARERWSRCKIMVTDSAIVQVGPASHRSRIAFRSIRRIRRDLRTGGIALEGTGQSLRIPPELMPDAQHALASQLRFKMSTGDADPLDTTGWYPRP